MTNSQPVVTPNALNFTPDNLHCYAYSGEIQVDDTATTLLEFKTNSEYILARVQFNINDGAGEAYQHLIYFNNVVIQGYKARWYENLHYLDIVIPPFTLVTLTSDNVEDSDSRTCIVSLTGKTFGMTETGFQ